MGVLLTRSLTASLRRCAMAVVAALSERGHNPSAASPERFHVLLAQPALQPAFRRRSTPAPSERSPYRYRLACSEIVLAIAARECRRQWVAWAAFSASRVLLVFGRPIARSFRISLAHVSALLRVPVIVRAGEMIDA